MQEQRVMSIPAVVDLKPPPAETLPVDKANGKNGSLKRVKSPITATSYSVAALQTATNSFSPENIVGEGSLGRVYRADFPHSKDDQDIVTRARGDGNGEDGDGNGEDDGEI